MGTCGGRFSADPSAPWPLLRSVWWSLSSSCLSLTSWSLRGTQGPGPSSAPQEPSFPVRVPTRHRGHRSSPPDAQGDRRKGTALVGCLGLSAESPPLLPAPSDTPGVESSRAGDECEPTAGRQALRHLACWDSGPWVPGVPGPRSALNGSEAWKEQKR